jgi:hypothetical protein
MEVHSSFFISFQKNQQETTGNIQLQSTCDQDQLRVQSKLFEEMFGRAWETGDSSVVEDFQNGLADCGSTLVHLSESNSLGPSRL